MFQWGGAAARPRDENFLRERGGLLRDPVLRQRPLVGAAAVGIAGEERGKVRAAPPPRARRAPTVTPARRVQRTRSARRSACAWCPTRSGAPRP